MKNSESKKSFVVIEGEEELRRIMAEPLEKWRVFLHPTQRKIVKKNYKGAARVLGGAGTGKTVVAMHRAKYLASKLGDDERILFTTFTANLAEDIKSNLRKICSLDELQKIEVINLDAWVMRFLSEVGFSAKIEYGEEIDKLWQRAVVDSLTDLDFPWPFYKDEWNRVVIPQETLSLEKYVKAKRTGRGVRLDRKKRIEVWKVFDAYLSLKSSNKRTDSDHIREYLYTFFCADNFSTIDSFAEYFKKFCSFSSDTYAFYESFCKDSFDNIAEALIFRALMKMRSVLPIQMAF